MGGERGGQGVGRERVTPETDASTHCQSRSYGATKALGTAAVTAERDEAVSWRRGLRQQHAEESSLLRRLLSSIGVLALFAFAVATANYRRLETGQHGATPIKTSFDRIVDDAAVASLTVTATNEYGRYSDAALALYGLEMVVEPHRETTLTATPSSLLGAGGADGDGDDRDSPPDSSTSIFTWRLEEVIDGEAVYTVFESSDAGPQTSVVFTKPGGIFRLTVEQYSTAQGPANSGSARLMARTTVTASCKYVRRELRELTDADRVAVLDAMEAYYTVPTKEGRAKYGEGFFNYELLTALHNADLGEFCYHAGLQFLTAHSAFGLMMERSLQSVNPRVSLPFWDFMIEAETLGADWASSAIFSDDMFGRAMGSAENSYQLTEGRFGSIASIYDPDGNLVDIDCHHNAYGYLGPTHDYQDLPLMTRANSFCNLKARADLATSDVFFACFGEHDTVADWEHCMETKVHGDIHGLLGGAFDCGVDMQQFQREHPELGAELLTFVVGFVASKYWPNNAFLPGSNECDTECTRGQAKACGCTCSIDALAISGDEVYSLTEGFMSAASERFAGDKFISFDESSDRPWGFKQDGVRLDDDATILLLRYVVKLGCEPSAVGSMVGGVSPQDPLFFVLHPVFEKAWHVLLMCPKFQDSYSFEWEDGACASSKREDSLPFTEKGLGFGQGEHFMTNGQLLSRLDPSNPGLPYVYDSFSKWGTTDDWDFCPECTAAAAAAAASSAA